MKKVNLFAAMVVALLAVESCGSKGQQQQQVSYDEDYEAYEPTNRDTTIYGLCADGSAMNTIQLIADNGDTLTLSLLKAQEAGLVLGGYNVGDRMAVLPDAKRDTALQVINLSALLGDWVMPNPLDGSSETGISIKEGGIAEGIEQAYTIYRTWKIYNGKLELISMREGGAGDEEINLYDIVSLTPDSLVFKDEEDIYEYGRKQENKGYGREIKLEEASEDDYRM